MAARRALRITRNGPYEPLRAPAYVAAFTPVANIAVGDETPWGVAAELGRLLPGTETGTYGNAGAVAADTRTRTQEILRAAGSGASSPSSATHIGTPG